MRSSLRFWCILFLAFTLSTSLYSQAQKIDMPDGEAVVCIETYDAGGQMIKFVATRSTLYSVKLSSSTWQPAKELMQTIPTRRIVHFAVRDDGATKATLAILLDDGSVWVRTYPTASDAFDVTPIILDSPFAATGQQTYKKVLLNTSVYVHFSNSMFSNKLDGAGWSFDSTGINRATIADIALYDKTQVIAATSKGVSIFDATARSWSAYPGFDPTIASLSIIRTIVKKEIYVGTQTKGVYFSDNNGTSWSSDTIGLNGSIVSKWAEDGTGIVFGASSTAIFRKPVSGTRQWLQADADLKSQAVSAVAVNYINAKQSLEVGTSFGVFTSIDVGVTYKVSNTGIKAENISGLLFPDATTTMASTSLGIFKKSGTAWTQVYPTSGYLASRPIYRSDIVNKVFTQLAGVGTQQGAILYTIDNGTTWNVDTVGLGDVPFSANISPITYFDRKGNKHIGVSGTSGIPIRFYSDYSTWGIDTVGFNMPGSNRTLLCLGIHTDNNSTNEYVSGGIYSGGGFTLQDIMLFKRTFGTSVWSPDTMGLNKTPIIAFASNKTVLFGGASVVGGVASLFKKNGNQWSKIPSPSTATSDTRAMVVDSAGKLYVAYSGVLSNNLPNRGVYSTSDDGATWLYGGLDSVAVRGLVATLDGVYAYTNRGSYKIVLQSLKSAKVVFAIHSINFDSVAINSFKDTTMKISNTGDDTLRVTRFQTSPQTNTITVTPPSFNIAPGQSQNVTIRYSPRAAGILSTTLRVTSNALPDTVYLTGFGVKSGGQIQIAERSIIFNLTEVKKSSDTVTQIRNIGTDTIKVSNVISTNSVFSALDTTFVIPPSGLFNLRLRFSPVAEGVQNGRIRIVSDAGNDSINVLGNGGTVSVDESNDATRFGLQIAPNPVTQESSVSFVLPEPQHVRLHVVDLTGETIATICNEKLTDGVYVYSLASVVKEGYSGQVLFLRLELPNSNATLKFMVR